jgi:hypothetical protein
LTSKETVTPRSLAAERRFAIRSWQFSERAAVIPVRCRISAENRYSKSKSSNRIRLAAESTR